ncbi:MAG TPA: glycosyltransferase family 9 protein [Bryobacteraceae bacterium]|nr:glycosyltransferase family 9 protein [Bryobacteraceae bacterium]
MSVLEQLPDGARVAVIRLRSLGDCVLTTPALWILHNSRPDLKVGVAVERRFAAVFEGNPAVAEILEPSLSAVAGFRPQLCLNLHGGTRSMWMTAASMAGHRAGFAHHKGAFVYNCPIPRAQRILGVQRTVHTAEHLASAIFHLGAARTEIPRASLFADAPAPSPPYAVFHPIAATPAKTWNARGFRAVAEHLEREHDLQPVFIAGPGEDLSAFEGYRTIAGAPLAATKTLLKGASLFVGNDSGPAHMAAAFGMPVVVLFGPSDSVVWAPWRTACEVIARPDGIDRIDPATVIAAVDRVRVRA